MHDDPLLTFLIASRALVVFSGAGISTESGIPDYRGGPDSVWQRYDPRELTFDRYVASAEVRGMSWEMRRIFFAAGALPNAGHLALAALEDGGRSVGVITQNIDGLHTAAGSRTVVEIHGTARDVICIGTTPQGGRPAGCGFRTATVWAFDRIDAGDPDPGCPSCGGLVKSATISFGQAMDETSFDRAGRLIEAADAMLVVGSSLVVHPAAGLPLMAVARGLPLAIVNAEPTPLDHLADVVVHGGAGETLAPAVSAVLGSAIPRRT